MKQLCLALHTYHDQAHAFPPSSTWPNPKIFGARGSTTNELGPNWVILILPFAEQQSIYDTFDLTQFTTAPINQVARGVDLKFMLCPTDGFNSTKFIASGANLPFGDGWARGNYAANGSLTYLDVGTITTAGTPADGWTSPDFQGVMGPNFSLGIGEIGDGTSNTVIVGEIRAGVVDIDSRGVWAMSGACPSALFAHGCLGDDAGPNNNYSIAADDVAACTQIQQLSGGAAELQAQGMSCSSGNWPNFQQSMRSMHAGGVYSGLGDGSVKWISDWIDVSRGNCNRKSVWDRINLSNDGLYVDQNSF